MVTADDSCKSATVKPTRRGKGKEKNDFCAGKGGGKIKTFLILHPFRGFFCHIFHLSQFPWGMDWLRFPLERELGRVATSSSSSSSSRTSRLLLSSNLRCLARDEFRSIGPVPNELHPNPFPPTYAMRFCPSAGEVLGMANEDGCVALQDTRAGARGDGRELGLMRGFRAHANACFDLAWPRQDAARMVTVSADQTCRAWSLGEGRFRCERIFRGHFRSVKAVEFTPSSRDVFVTGATDLEKQSRKGSFPRHF